MHPFVVDDALQDPRDPTRRQSLRELSVESDGHRLHQQGHEHLVDDRTMASDERLSQPEHTRQTWRDGRSQQRLEHLDVYDLFARVVGEARRLPRVVGNTRLLEKNLDALLLDRCGDTQNPRYGRRKIKIGPRGSAARQGVAPAVLEQPLPLDSVEGRNLALARRRAHGPYRMAR